jgi:NigD-like C-terminal beta sandwich domain
MKVFALLCLAVVFLSCSDNSNFFSPIAADPNPYLTGKIFIVDSLNTNSLSKDYLKVIKQFMVNDFLNLTVQYYGGCKEHEVNIYIPKGIIKTNPPQFELFISHNGNHDSCESIVTKVLKINILGLKEFYKSRYNSGDQIVLRIYEPNSNTPVEPLLRYPIL